MTDKTVLLADDDPAFLRMLKRRCRELGLEAQTAADGLEAMMVALQTPPDLLILDIKLPGADGLDVCEKLAQIEATASVPVIIVSGMTDEETMSRCRSLGAHYVVKNMDLWDELKPVICRRLNIEPEAKEPEKAEKATPGPSRSASSRPKVLVIDDDPQITRAVMIRLGALGIEVVRAPSAKVGALLAKSERPDLIITDQNMPEMSGEHLLVNLKADVETRDIPVAVLTGQTMDGREDFALKREMLGRRGAVAYLAKPLDFDLLLDLLGRHIRIPASPSQGASAPLHPA